MKAIVAIFLFVSLVSFVHSAAPTCPAANYCMACGITNADACAMCFNYKKGKVGPKLMTGVSQAVGTHCQTAMTTEVANCKIYDGSGSNTTTANKCLLCESNHFKNLTYTGGALTTIACSKTAITLSTACAKIDNCEQMVCKDDTTDAHGCQFCKKGYYNGTYVTGMGSSNCIKGVTITNCEMSYATGTTTHGCYYCKSGYAVNAANDTGCTAYTTDSNCRKLQLDGTTTYCYSCWDAYYWNATKCKLSAGVVVMGAVMALMSFLM